MEMKPKQALITLPIVIVFVGVFFFYLSVFPFTAGLNWIAMCFVFFWTTIMHSDLKQIVPTFAGAILGLAIAAVPAVLGPMTSPLIGFVAYILLILALLYFFYVSQLKFVANPAALMFLTVGTFDIAKEPVFFLNMMLTVTVTFAFLGILFFGLSKIPKKEAKAAKAE